MKRFASTVLLSVMPLSAGVFDAGSKSISLSVGSGSGFDSTYTIVGVTGSYFMANGLAVGIGYRGWYGGTPTMHEVVVPATYYIPLASEIRPYAGGFYRHTFIDGVYSDYDTYGVRGGVAYVEGNGYVAAGWVQEWYSNANGDDASRGYPEIAAGIRF